MVSAPFDRIVVGIVEVINLPNSKYNPLEDEDYLGEIYALKNGIGISLWSGRYVR